MTSPKPRPGILDITPYQPGDAGSPGNERIFKLSSNESALGPSPKAMAAYADSAQSLHRYPNGDATPLREALAAEHGLDAARIVCGAGSDELLQLLTRAYVGEGDNIVQTEHGFLVYALSAKACGANVRFAKEKNLTADVDAILSEIDDRTRIVFIANPNNPTGTYIADSEIRRLRRAMPDDVLLVIDAAYAEYMDAPDYHEGVMLVDENDNVVVTRTFSKIFGLGALRLGWAYCPANVADVLNRIRGPFNVSAPAIAAGVAAVADKKFLEENKHHNREERKKMSGALAQLGLDVVPSHGNFILVKFPDDADRNADAVLAYLKSNGVLVRAMHGYGLGAYLRISIGETDANQTAIDLLTEKFSGE